MNTFKWFLNVLLIIVLAVGVVLLLNKGFVSLEHRQNQACRRFYGPRYVFIRGKKSPNLCVTAEGDVRYYELIK